VLDRLTAKAGEVVSKERLIAEVFQLGRRSRADALEVQHRAAAKKSLNPDGPAIKTLRGLGYMLKAFVTTLRAPGTCSNPR